MLSKLFFIIKFSLDIIKIESRYDQHNLSVFEWIQLRETNFYQLVLLIVVPEQTSLFHNIAYSLWFLLLLAFQTTLVIKFMVT